MPKGRIRVQRIAVTGAITALGIVIAALASPTAYAGQSLERVVAVPSGSPTPARPLMLASTGLDITIPIIIGLSVLVLGTVMVGWAFLATGRHGRQR